VCKIRSDVCFDSVDVKECPKCYAIRGEKFKHQSIIWKKEFDLEVKKLTLEDEVKKCIELKYEVPLSSNNYCIGILDCNASFRPKALSNKLIEFNRQIPDNNTVYVEVKTKITSVWEVLRQINIYKKYLHANTYHYPDGNFILVVPNDFEYIDIFRQQGIEVIIVKN